jgi:mono/diheme cytochrome c family protein
MRGSLLACAASILAGMPLAAQHTEPAKATPSSHIIEGKRIFEMNCSVGYCHGLEGRAGKGPRLRDRVWSKSYLYRTIEKGIPNSSMPAWQGRLTAQNIDDVVSYIISISHEQPGPEIHDDKSLAARSEPVPGKDVALGKEIFFDSAKDHNCGNCHRIAGSGTPVAPSFPNFSDRPDAALLRQIVEEPPHRELVRINLKEGDTVCGTEVSRGSGILRVYDLTGAGPPVLRTISQASIAKEEPCTDLNVHQNNSRDYTAGQLDSIVAFLRSSQ